MIKKCFFEQALSQAYKHEVNDAGNLYIVFDKRRTKGTQRSKFNNENCVISTEYFTDVLNRFVESYNQIDDNFSNLTFINYEEIKYDMDGVLQKLFNLEVSAKDKFDLSFNEISKTAFLDPESDNLKKFKTYSNTNQSFMFPIQKIKLQDKINLIQNYDELLHKYQLISRNSNFLNYVSEQDIQNRIEKENKHYLD